MSMIFFSIGRRGGGDIGGMFNQVVTEISKKQ